MPPIEELLDRLAKRLTATDEPISRQLADTLWVAVVEGVVATGERLPTARQLAIALGISPRSVEGAYAELEERGVVATRPTEGVFISLQSPSAAELERHRHFADLCREAFARARGLGYGVDELIDALAEFRTVEPRKPE